MNFLFADHTYLEVRDKIDAGWNVILPTGCTEQQGPHLPVDFDTWFAEHVSRKGAQETSRKYGVNYLVLPALPFGPTPEHRNFGFGFIDLPHQLHEDLVYHILKSLGDQGFRRIVVLRGCGEHRLGEPVARFNQKAPPGSRAVVPGKPYRQIWEKVADPSIPGGHADSFTTSISLYLRPESVRQNKIYCPEQTQVDWNQEKLDFRKHSESGVIGDPTHASKELGMKLWEALIEEVSWILKEIVENGECNSV